MTRNSAFFKEKREHCSLLPHSPVPDFSFAFSVSLHFVLSPPFSFFPHPARFFFPTVPLSFRITPRLPIRAFPPFPSLFPDSLFFSFTLSIPFQTRVQRILIFWNRLASVTLTKGPFSVFLSSSSYSSENVSQIPKARLGFSPSHGTWPSDAPLHRCLGSRC